MVTGSSAADPAHRPARITGGSEFSRLLAQTGATCFAQAGAAWARARLAGAWVRQDRARLLAGPDERLTGWMSVCLAIAGDLVFASKDTEASWHAWDMERRHAGLGRAYRDPRFDTLVSCPRCHNVSTVADGSACRQCSAAERLVTPEPAAF